MSGLRVCAESAGENILMENLPTDVLLIIFLYCDEVSLGRLSQQCRRFYEIINDDCIWVERSKKAVVTNQLSKQMQDRSFSILPMREKCRISTNWRKGRFKENVYFSQKIRYMPWLIINHHYLWVSKGNTILCYQRKTDGIRSNCPVQRLTGHADDVCRFVKAGDTIISGGRDGAICAWSSITGNFVLYHQDCHASDINSVTVVNDILVSGSRDKTAKLWRWQYKDCSCELLRTVDVQDRIWSTAANPQGNIFAVGSSGYFQIPPLHLYDIEHGHEIMHFNGSYVSGAGILDILWETPHLLYSTGYDGYIRLWDTRIGSSVNTWEDPYDSSIYCLALDNVYTILCGTSQHGRVQLWDKRQSHSLQMYFMSANHSSPVYSLSFDASLLFVALDQSINVMDFSCQRKYGIDMLPQLVKSK